MDATRSEIFMRDLINTIMHERIMLEMIMKKFVIDVEEKDIGHAPARLTNIW